MGPNKDGKWVKDNSIYIFDSDLFLNTRNLLNERTKSPFEFVFTRLLYSQKACVKFFFYFSTKNGFKMILSTCIL